MTLHSRNLLIGTIFLVLSTCMGIIVFLVLRVNFNSENLLLALVGGKAQYIHLTWKLSPQTPYINLISPAISIIFAWSAALVFLRNFRKVTSPQLFFLVLFWLSMGIEIIRSLNLFYLMQDISITQRIIFSRISIMGRLLGSLALFAASLYMVGVKTQHQGIILLVITIISVGMANFIPIDSTRIGQELLFLPSNGYSLDIFRLVVGTLSILNFAKYAFSSKENSNYLLLLAVVFLIIGLELQYIATEWILTSVSWLFLAIGTAWLARRFITNYMWY